MKIMNHNLQTVEQQNVCSFSRLFQPRGIAVVGASANLSRIGGQPIRALIAAGYAGGIYPVNPKYQEIAGMRCYASVSDIDGACDLAVVAVPAAAVPNAVRTCGAKGIPFAIVLSGGFKEADKGGRDIEQDLKRAACESGVRVIGPNCQGMLIVPERVYATFGAPAGETDLRPGGVSMVFQSGGFGFSVVMMCEALGIGFRHCISIGNEADVTTPELLNAFVDDPRTQLACAYIEGVSDGRALMQVGEKSLRVDKPVLIWKGGKTDAGARAAASHTANMTGRYDVYRAAFRQSGIIEVNDVEEMADLYRVFAGGRKPAGRGVGVLGISGGSGVVFADTATQLGLTLPQFSADTAQTLARVVPTFGSTANPADITADIFNNISSFTEAVEVVLRDPEVHQLAILLASLPGSLALDAVNAIVTAASKSDKPVLVGWSARRHRAEEAYRVLEDAQIPIIPTPVRIARVSAALAVYAETQRKHLEHRATPPVGIKPAIALPARAGTLSEVDSKRILAAHGVPVTRDVLVRPGEDPAVVAGAFSFPVAVKIVSPDIPHKTEVGGVRLDIPDASALRTAVDEIHKSARHAAPRARIDGVIVSEMIIDGVETLVGAVTDPTFGPTVAFGLGGIFTEVLHDVTYRVAPFDLDTAHEMIRELRGRKILDGSRGRPALDVEALAQALVDVSNMAWAMRDRIQELDINPLFVRPKGMGVVALDGLVVLRG